MKVEDIVKATNGKLLVGKLQENCENFCTDTRKIQKGDVYVGLKGEKFNGNEYYKDALEKGAKVAVISGIKISEEDLKQYNDKTIIEVEDSLEAFGDIARYKRELYNIPVIQITGSVGKTSTRDIIANVVRTQYKTLQTEGNQNNAIGLPTTLLKLKNHEAVVVESGMNHLGEIRYLGKIAKPTVAVITNIGTAHIGFLGSRENILKAKNPAGTITDDLWETIGQAMELSGDGNCHVIEVDGEEDLAVLPCILMASDETTILYGQPNEGLVLLKVYDAKDYAQNLIDTFIKE